MFKKLWKRTARSFVKATVTSGGTFLSVVEDYIHQVTDTMDLTLFHSLELAVRDVLWEEGRTPRSVLIMSAFLFAIKHINRNLIGNPNIPAADAQEFVTGIIPFLKNFHKCLSVRWHRDRKVLVALSKLHNFVELWIRSRRQPLKVETPFLEGLLCHPSPENQRRIDAIIQGCQDAIERITGDLKRKNALLVFVAREVGGVGMVMLLGKLVRATGINATELNMQLAHPRCYAGYGEVPKGRDCILIYDEDLTGHEIAEIERALDEEEARLRGIIALRRGKYNGTVPLHLIMQESEES